MKKDVVFYSSLIMAFSAGFVDASTFTAADGLFSAHITGNIVVFAYKLSQHPVLRDFINLMSLPVFILAIIITKKVDNHYQNQSGLFRGIGIVLIVAGIGAYLLRQFSIDTGFIYHLMLMMIVFAMGIQNTATRIYIKSVFGPTTVMTGNMTVAIVDFFSYISTKKTFEKVIESKKSLVLLVGFFLGSTLGALISARFGLLSMLVPGILITIYYSFIPGKMILSTNS